MDNMLKDAKNALENREEKVGFLNGQWLFYMDSLIAINLSIDHMLHVNCFIVIFCSLLKHSMK